MIWIALAVWLIVAVAVFVCLVVAMSGTGWLMSSDWIGFALAAIVWPFTLTYFAADWIRSKIRGL